MYYYGSKSNTSLRTSIYTNVFKRPYDIRKCNLPKLFEEKILSCSLRNISSLYNGMFLYIATKIYNRDYLPNKSIPSQELDELVYSCSTLVSTVEMQFLSK